MDTVRVFSPPWTRAELIELLRRRIALLASALPIRRARLFGSWAKGRATVASDVDLLLVVDAAIDASLYARVWKLLDLPRVELHLHSCADAELMRATLDRMTRESVDLLSGAETHAPR